MRGVCWGAVESDPRQGSFNFTKFEGGSLCKKRGGNSSFFLSKHHIYEIAVMKASAVIMTMQMGAPRKRTNMDQNPWARLGSSDTLQERRTSERRKNQEMRNILNGIVIERVVVERK